MTTKADVAGINRLTGSQRSTFDNWISNEICFPLMLGTWYIPNCWYTPVWTWISWG